MGVLSGDNKSKMLSKRGAILLLALSSVVKADLGHLPTLKIDGHSLWSGSDNCHVECKYENDKVTFVQPEKAQSLCSWAIGRWSPSYNKSESYTLNGFTIQSSPEEIESGLMKFGRNIDVDGFTPINMKLEVTSKPGEKRF